MSVFNANDPNQNWNFRRRWNSTVPPSAEENRLAYLRSVHGNAEGTRVHARELHGRKADWLFG